ncbi:MAG TPA: hypothetical protein VFW92_11420 [Candidatus Limnocylindrales bacterium]|nr:hypothetical protein [Candidatus Limnocylindrales bacterium]
MTADPLAFFTIDHGTASTAAALVAPVAGRFRLLAAAAQPGELPLEPLLEGLVQGVVAADPEVVPGTGSWPTWTRLETATRAPLRALVAAGSDRSLGALEVAATGAGWRIVERISPDRTDALEATRLCLDEGVDIVAVAGEAVPRPDERRALDDLLALVAAVRRRRPDLPVLLCGGAAAGLGEVGGDGSAAGGLGLEGSGAGGLGAEGLILGPAPTPSPPGVASPLRLLCGRLGSTLPTTGSPLPDGRICFVTAIRSLATLLERRVEGVDVGFAAGQRVLATSQGLRGWLCLAEAGLVPEAALTDDALTDAIVDWSTLRADQQALRDLVRNLRLRPWAGAGGEGAHLRLAAARAALERLDAAWRLGPEPDGRPPSYHSDLLVASGGAFAVAPPSAVALALVDTLRRSGAMTLVLDHARLLAPLGALEAEEDRQRVLADLLDDALLPLGSAIVASGLRAGRRAGTLRVAGSATGATSEVPVVPGDIEIVDLPPGLTATAELDLRDGAWLGMRARKVSIEVGGGLGGLLIDTRDIPLRLPERSERRRELLDAWQGPLWGDD